MVKRLTELSSTRKPFSELPRKLLHFSKCDDLGHFAEAHFEELEQYAFLFFDRRLVGFAALEHVLKLAKDPGVLHRSAADQDPVYAGLSPAFHSVIDSGDVAVAGYRYRNRFL